ncbi:MAG: hypothetical protein KHZ77_06915 [Veillonella sp.]|uniref:hypothetical protein n=1 Tax=Veillonella sp. TaxID=1926307 RepID=UPI0025DA6620|nr:hypothetical protein [Veillonella sp.]MBS4913882.1 hypothetical protein [Veillonella sp.]
MKHEYTGITVGHKFMLGATMEYRDGEFMLVDAFKLARQGTLREDCKRFITHFSLEGANLAVTAVSDRRDQLMVTPELSRFETADLLKWQITDCVEWPEDYYFYDFVIEDMPEDMKRDGDAEQQLVYVVALPKQIVTEMATGFLEGHGNLEVIDFFPGALMRRYVEHKGCVLALVGEHNIELTAWYRHMCVCKKVVPIEAGAFQAALEHIETELFEYGVPGICGIAMFKTDTVDMFYTSDDSGNIMAKEAAYIYDHKGGSTHNEGDSNHNEGHSNLNAEEVATFDNATEPTNIDNSVQLESVQLERINEIMNIYDPLTPIPYTVDFKQRSNMFDGRKHQELSQKTVDEMAATDPLTWDMAMGLAIRGLYRPSY